MNIYKTHYLYKLLTPGVLFLFCLWVYDNFKDFNLGLLIIGLFVLTTSAYGSLSFITQKIIVDNTGIKLKRKGLKDIFIKWDDIRKIDYSRTFNASPIYIVIGEHEKIYLIGIENTKYLILDIYNHTSSGIIINEKVLKVINSIKE